LLLGKACLQKKQSVEKDRGGRSVEERKESRKEYIIQVQELVVESIVGVF